MIKYSNLFLKCKITYDLFEKNNFDKKFNSRENNILINLEVSKLGVSKARMELRSKQRLAGHHVVSLAGDHCD